VRTLFLTGGTGMLGTELVATLLRATDWSLILMAHADGAGPPADARVRTIRGDMTQPRLGLEPAVYRSLAGEVDAIMHAAASTRFDLPLPAARRANVTGTKNVVRFAKRCARLERFGLVSTAYVSGRRTGLILEAEREHQAGFVNSYEQAKYEAEALLEMSADGLPWTVYRLSTLLGDSRTGATSRFTVPHHSLRMMYAGLASLVPGDPDCPVDLMPTDVAASLVAELFGQRFQPGRTLHLVAGPEKSLTLREVIDHSYACLADADPSWSRRPHVKPAIGSPAAFELLVRSAEEARSPLMQGALGTLKSFAGQFSYPKTFDTAQVRAALPDYDRRVPHVREYYANVVRYCVQTGWGRARR
jgi:nucleoside-diphosphate-sugar epimerase